MNPRAQGEVVFVGAGPGASDLITLRGARVIAEADIVIWASSLVDEGIVAGARPDALVIDSASEVAAAFFAGRCAAYTSDTSQLAAARIAAPGGPDDWVILPETISKEPLAPVVWGDDPCRLPKARKTAAEIEGMRAAHLGWRGDGGVSGLAGPPASRYADRD